MVAASNWPNVVNLKSLNMAEIINENIDLLKANAQQKGIS